MTRTIPSTAPAFSRSEERAILTVTCSAAFLFFNSFGSIGVAFPTIQKQFSNRLSVGHLDGRSDDIEFIVLLWPCG